MLVIRDLKKRVKDADSYNKLDDVINDGISNLKKNLISAFDNYIKHGVEEIFGNYATGIGNNWFLMREALEDPKSDEVNYGLSSYKSMIYGLLDKLRDFFGNEGSAVNDGGPSCIIDAFQKKVDEKVSINDFMNLINGDDAKKFLEGISDSFSNYMDKAVGFLVNNSDRIKEEFSDYDQKIREDILSRFDEDKINSLIQKLKNTEVDNLKEVIVEYAGFFEKLNDDCLKISDNIDSERIKRERKELLDKNKGVLFNFCDSLIECFKSLEEKISESKDNSADNIYTHRVTTNNKPSDPVLKVPVLRIIYNERGEKKVFEEWLFLRYHKF